MGRRKINKGTDDLGALKRELVSAISHIVRTPLSIAKEGLSLLLDEIPGKLNPKQRKIIRVAKKNIDRLTASVENILQKPCDSIIRQTRSQVPYSIEKYKCDTTCKGKK